MQKSCATLKDMQTQRAYFFYFWFSPRRLRGKSAHPANTSQRTAEAAKPGGFSPVSAPRFSTIKHLTKDCHDCSEHFLYRFLVSHRFSQDRPDRRRTYQGHHSVTPPEHLIRFFPIRGTAVETLIGDTRRSIHNIMRAQDDRLLVIVGPCSIHDPAAALDYARRLAVVREQYKDTLEVVMRVCFEKPRTTVGWKGLINDPYLDQSYRIDEGLRIARQLLIDINRLGVPAASEFLDVISPQYIGDLISWGAIGARTTESQVHRELASGISAPIGFKNGTDGNIRIATDAIQSASRGHHFLSVHKNGQVAIVHTGGNQDCHVILRGGKTPTMTPSMWQPPAETWRLRV